MFDGKIQVGYGLRLNPLGRIHNQKSTLARSYGTGDLIREVHMARSVNQIEDILLPIAYIIHLDSMALDGDALFFLQIHRVQHLGFHIPAAQCVRYLQHPVRQSAFPMIDMCYYAKIPRVVHISAAVADPYIT